MIGWISTPIRIADGEDVDVEVHPGLIHKIRLGSLLCEDRFWMDPDQARTVAAQLIAAADYAEGLS